MFKKFLSVTLSLLLVVGLVACGEGSATISVSSDDGESSNVKVVANTNLKAQIQNLVTLADTVSFGTTTGSKEPIEWYVLEDDGSKALLLSKYLLERKAYNDESVDITWENCTCRKWLNSEYINLIFSKNEQKSILTTDVVNNNNAIYGTNGGNNTKDKLFLLSIDEFKKYYPNGSEAQYKNGSSGWWWLRSPARLQNFAADVGDYGYLLVDGDFVYYGGGIRPALWVKY